MAGGGVLAGELTACLHTAKNVRPRGTGVFFDGVRLRPFPACAGTKGNFDRGGLAALPGALFYGILGRHRTIAPAALCGNFAIPMRCKFFKSVNPAPKGRASADVTADVKSGFLRICAFFRRKISAQIILAQLCGDALGLNLMPRGIAAAGRSARNGSDRTQGGQQNDI